MRKILSDINRCTSLQRRASRWPSTSTIAVILTSKSMRHIETTFRRYVNYMKTVSAEKIRQYVDILQSKTIYSAAYISRMLQSLRQVVAVSYKLDGEFPDIPIVVNEKASSEELTVTESDILKAHKVLIRMEDFESALMLQLMFVLQALPFELRWLRFEDVIVTKDNKFLINFRQTKAARIKRVMLADKIYEEIMSFLNLVKGDDKKYYLGRRAVSKKKKLVGHFIFNICSDTMTLRLRSGFNNKVPWFSCTSADVAKVLKVS